MSAAMRKPRTFTPEEYLMIEREADYKSEYFNGEIVAMAGASMPHIFINANLHRAVGNRIAGSGCREAGNDMKIRTPTKGMFSYPDLTVICGEPQFHDRRRDVVINPVAIFEILSPSTEKVDRSIKFEMYQELENLREYVLIAQDKPHIEWYSRPDSGDVWTFSIARGLAASITLPTLGVTIPLSEIYAGITFPPALSLTDEE